MYKFSVPFSVKSVEENSIEGLGSVFGNVDLGADIVVQGAFNDSLRRHKSEDTMPAMLWQHQTDQIPGVWVSARETEVGLMLKGEFADTQLGRETRILAKMRAVRGLSIGGMINDFDFDKKGNRVIKEFDLWEVSPVTFPMNPKAQIEAVKSLYPDPRALENHLCEAGCSRKTAKDIVHDLLDSDVRSENPDQCEVDQGLLKELAERNDILFARLIQSKRNFSS